MKNKLKSWGIFLFLLGSFILLDSFSGITGYAVAEQVGKITSSIFGLIFILGGLGMFLSGGKINTYNKIVGGLYTTLATKSAYGHHTEKIKDVTNTLEKYGPQKIVKKVIKKQIKSGYLNSIEDDSVSLTMDTNKLEEIIKNHGKKISDEALKRIIELKEKKAMSGVR